MTIGIYSLSFTGTNKIYVGQSINIERRYKQHINDLNLGTASPKLLEAYKLYDIPAYTILLECSKEELNVNEIEAIEVFNSIAEGLNTQPGGGAWPILSGESNPNSIHKNSDIVYVFLHLVNNIDKPIKVLAKELNIHVSTVKNIANGQGYKWLKDIYPNEYKILEGIKGNRPINSLKYSGKPCPTTISPEGVEYVVENISRFAKEHGLNAGAFGEVLRGKAAHHKGWKLK